MVGTGNFGLYEGAYFVGRQELLGWLNGLLKTSYTKVEQCGNGAAYCQVLDALYQDSSVPMRKVNFDAKLEHEMVKNFKIMQAVLDKKGVDKLIPVERLVRMKYQDNLEFLQWCKRFYETQAASGMEETYDASGRRGGRGPTSTGAAPSSQAATAAKGAPRAGRRAGDSSQRTASAGTQDGAKRKPVAGRRAAPASAPSGQVAALTARLEESEKQNSDMKVTVSYLEKERDFYFQKLRRIEILCQTTEGMADSPFTKQVLGILWREEEDPIEEDDGQAPNPDTDIAPSL